jgi:CHAT domain-containing protein
LDADRLVTASDILRARRVPWLIVANACYSGALREGESYPSLDDARRGASIAEAFMERGVQNYLGTGWTVDDAQAAKFAKIFYKALFENESLGDAVASARAAIFDEPIGSTWGAYQLYGDPSDALVPRARSESAQNVRAPRRPSR